LGDLCSRGGHRPAAVAAAQRRCAKYLVENAGSWSATGPRRYSELLVGFASGVIIGLSLGILMQVWRWFREAAYPWLVATQMVPIPAVAPILVLWFGFTIVPKAATVALMCFFPVAVNTVDGLSSREPRADPPACGRSARGRGK
jgi:ABC-type nitrate/sulfonate/bicarbonate transport system permease component